MLEGKTLSVTITEMPRSFINDAVIQGVLITQHRLNVDSDMPTPNFFGRDSS